MITEVIDFEDGDGPWNHLRFADDFDFDFAPACPKAALFGAQAM